jgi:Cof subfamily protein (haloacid dehalogenase superfamily)
MAVKMILFDLDGTLLNSKKTISEYTRQVLLRAAEKGIHIVPSTGRLFHAVPEEVRNLPGVRYAIAINGALVLDTLEQKVLHDALLPVEHALEICEYLETLPVIFDCFQNNTRYMSRSNDALLERYITEPRILKMVRETREEVDDLKTYLREKGQPLQKLQSYFLTQELRSATWAELTRRFPQVMVTSSLGYNVEINGIDANKGEAMAQLCKHLGISPEEVLACGDGSNDATMIRRAGIGVAMGNAAQELKDCADYITDTNDRDGVAKAIEKFCEL